MNIDWKAIRPLNGSQAEGFEELCAQLARAENPEGARFRRKGTPDAGVECYSTLPNGSEWGWQAKYFDSLGVSQWSQLDKSVKTALDKHPSLVRYFVCVPLDRPDARIDGRKSAMEATDVYRPQVTVPCLALSTGLFVHSTGYPESRRHVLRTEHLAHSTTCQVLCAARAGCHTKRLVLDARGYKHYKWR